MKNKRNLIRVTCECGRRLVFNWTHTPQYCECGRILEVAIKLDMRGNPKESEE